MRGYLPAILVVVIALAGNSASGVPAAEESQHSSTLTSSYLTSTNCVPSVDFTAGGALALRILTASTDELLIDETQFRALATEIDGVLERARQLEPATRAIGVRTSYEEGVLAVGVEGTLADRVIDAFGEQEMLTSLVTGFPDFDDLVARLCLQSATYHGFFGVVYAKFSDLLNTRSATAAFSAIPGVSYAHPNWSGIDGSDISLEKAGPEWYVVFRDAYGDCFAGCYGQTLYYFTVTAAGARLWCERDALQNPTLRRVAETWGPQLLPLVGAPCEQPEPSPPLHSLSPEPQSLPRTGGLP